jgi:hypothetical protein
MSVQTKEKQETVRIVIDSTLKKYIQKKKKSIPLFGTVEIIKMLLSKGLIWESEMGFSLADEILDQRQKNGKFLKVNASKQKEILDKLN